MSSKHNERSHPLAVYFVTTFAVTWMLWISAVLDSSGWRVPTGLLILSMVASFTPSITGLALYRRYAGKTSFRHEMRQRLSTRFAKHWLLTIPAFFFGLAGLSYGLTFVLVDDFEPVMAFSWPLIPLVFLQILFIGGALGEEFGWRGFALPRLLRLTSPAYATLILGVIWSIWHLPLFFIDGTVQSSLPLWQFMLQNTLLAFYYTWLYGKTRGNLWMMIYLHAVANTAAAAFPYWQHDVGRWIGFLSLFIACLMLYRMSPVRFDREEGVFLSSARVDTD